MKASNRFVGRFLLPVVLVVPTVILITPPAFAQDQDEEGAGVLEEVVITGSRIRQDPLEKRLPVLTLTEQDFPIPSGI